MPAAKIEARLREQTAFRLWFLERYHKETPPLVLDCSRGTGPVWHEIRRRNKFKTGGYWGIDRKASSRNLKAVAVLNQPGWDFDVVDLNADRAPWDAWRAICRHVSSPLTVFLSLDKSGQTLTEASAAFIGLSPIWHSIPNECGKSPAIQDLIVRAALSPDGVRITEARQVRLAGGARDLGLRLEPR